MPDAGYFYGFQVHDSTVKRRKTGSTVQRLLLLDASYIFDFHFSLTAEPFRAFPTVEP
jgi:hypothetical protein